MNASDSNFSGNFRPAHVVHVIGALQTGGAEKQLINYLRAADHEQFRHSVLCLGERGDMADEVADLEVPVVVRSVRFRNVLKDMAWLTRWFTDQQVDVIHAHMFYSALWSRVAGLRAGVPVMVTTEHGKELWKNRWQIFANRWLSKRTFRHIAVSEDVAGIRLRRDGFQPDKMVVIPNGVPIPDLLEDQGARARIRREFELKDGQPVFGTVGRVVNAKAYPVLLDALGQARATIPDLHWLQIGDGPDREPLMASAAALGITDSITFAGSRRDISDLLAAMDVWVMSSIREGLPVSLLEAMAARKPILATRVGGIPDAVTDGVSALLVAENDPAVLADGLIRLFQEDTMAGNLAVEARQRVERDFSIGAVAGRIEDIYRNGLSGTRSPK